MGKDDHRQPRRRVLGMMGAIAGGDAITFDRSLIFLFQSPRPPEQTREFKFSSTAYWYQNEAAELLFKLPAADRLVDWFRIRDRDHQSIP